MKNFLKSIFILLSIFSVLGIFVLIYIYIKKNLKVFSNLFNECIDSFKDGILEDKEVESIIERVSVVKEEIEKDVDRVGREFKKEVVVPVKRASKIIDKGVSKKNVKVSKGGLNSRQEQIFNYIKLNSEVKMSSVSQIFNKVTPRTLRRDFEKLQQLGLVRQEGKTRDAVYKII